MKQHASLNRSFRLVRRADAQVVPVPESARGHGGGRTRTTALATGLLLASAPLLAWAAPPGATQLPQGGNLVAGQAAWQSQGATLTVNQASQRAVIDWQSFNLGSRASVVFNQAAGRAGATLNRVLDSQPSQILGRIQAPGQVFISNPSGVIFGSGASVDVGGLVATSMSMGASDFMAGATTWQRNGATGAVLNAGSLTAAEGGYIALLAPEVRNEGAIVARAGTVVLAAGEAVRLEFADTRLGSVQVSAAQLKTLVENRHAILAPGGYVVLAARSADALRSGVVNQAGVIDAGSLVSRGGRVLLEADIISLAAGSRIDATGATGGGEVLVGGDWQGSGSGHQATRVAMAAGAGIDASATAQGDGGKVVLWSDIGRSDASTTVHGTIAARGGAQGGHGGRIETSGHQIDLAGIAVDASAPSVSGRGGQWLIDPTDLTIDAALAATTTTTLNSGTNVTVQTVGTGSQAGDITVNSEIAWTSNAALTLQAANDIIVSAPITATGANATLTLQYGQGAVAAGNTSRYGVYAPISLMAGPNFITQRGSDGTPVTHTVITALGTAGSTDGVTLQGMGGALAGNFVLGADIQAGSTSGWNGGLGFAPIGSNGSPFTGTLDGLGHIIYNVRIARPSTSYVGIFGALGSAGVIRNVGNYAGSITGSSHVGGLVGQNRGTIETSFTSGTVSGVGNVGGLAGSSPERGGAAEGAVIANSYSVAAVAASGSYAGGLVGDSGATITNSYAAISSVTAGSFAGSLIGYLNDLPGSSVTNSFGGRTMVGSRPNGNLTGGQGSSAIVVNSRGGVGSGIFSTATYTGWDTSRTWVMYDGYNQPSLAAFMRPLTVTMLPTTRTYNGSLSFSASDVSLSITSPGSLFRTGSLAYTGGGVSANAGTYTGVSGSGYWSYQEGYRILYTPTTLTINPASLTASGGTAVNRAYNGSTAASITGGVLAGTQYGSDSVSLSTAGSSFADPNVGTGKAVTAVYSLVGAGAGNYQLASAAPTGLTANITAAPLTVSGGTAASRVYDRTTVASITGASLSGTVYGADAVSLASSGSFADANVGTGKAVTAAFSLAGASAGNYQLTSTPTGLTANVTAAPLTVTGGAAAHRAYNGSTAAAVTGSLGGVLTGDSVSLQAAGQFADANVGAGKAVSATFALGGADAGNYQLVGATTASLAADITQLASVTWVGGTSGDWFSASNWAGGAVPTLGNVANVVIPTGAVASLTSSTTANAPALTSLSGAGGVQLTQASLSTTGAVNLGSVNLGAGSALAAGSLDTASYTQSGGSAAVTGALTVAGAFTQTGGTLRAGGAASVTQATGDLAVSHLVANGLSLAATQGDLSFTNLGSVGDAALSASGRVTEAAGGSLTVLGNASLVAGGDIAVDQARNMVVGRISVQGDDVRLTQGLDDLVLGDVAASGSLTLNATTGNIRQAANTALAVTGATNATAAQGSAYLMSATNQFGGAVSAAASDIAITQGARPLVLGTVAARANLAVASGGAVTQNGVLTVARQTSLDAGTNDVLLDNPANDFAGAVTVRAGALTLVDGVGGLSLGNVSTAGETLVNSLAGPTSQDGSVFTSTATGPARFNAWQDGVYTSVGVNTAAPVVINGQTLGAPSAAAAVDRGVASALNVVTPSVEGSAAGLTKARRTAQALTIPVVAPVSAD